MFAEVYPDDAVALPIRCAATVLARDEDWQWIAEHAAVIAGAVEDACTAVSGAYAGTWIVGRGSTEGQAFLVCTAANTVGSAACGVGNVVLVLRRTATGLPEDSTTPMPR